MSKRRMIDPNFWQSETMGGLKMFDRYLFIGIFSNADDQGRLRGHPALLRNAIFPFDDIKQEEIKVGLTTLQETGSIKVYISNGKEYIQVTGWWTYQQPQWAYPSEFPAPERWTDRLRYRNGGKVIEENWRGEGGFNQEPNPENSPENDPEPPTNNEDCLPKALGKTLGNALGKAIEIEIEIESVKDKESAAPPPPPEPPPKKQNRKIPLPIPAYKVFVEVTGKSILSKPQITEIGRVVGNSPAALEKWREVVSAWILRGHKPTNAAGMIDWFKSGIPAPPNSNGKGNGNGHTGKQAANGNGQTRSRLDEQPSFDPYDGKYYIQRNGQWVEVLELDNGQWADMSASLTAALPGV